MPPPRAIEAWVRDNIARARAVAAVQALAPVALRDPHPQAQQYALKALKLCGAAARHHSPSCPGRQDRLPGHRHLGARGPGRLAPRPALRRPTHLVRRGPPHPGRQGHQLQSELHPSPVPLTNCPQPEPDHAHHSRRRLQTGSWSPRALIRRMSSLPVSRGGNRRERITITITSGELWFMIPFCIQPMNVIASP